MAELEVTKDAIHIDCDCGAHIKLTKDSEGELKLKSTYTKKQLEKKEDGKTGKTKKDDGNDEPRESKSILDWLFDD